MTSKVFLSHSTDDKPLVERLAEKLVAEGIEPWLDKWNLLPGDAWQPEIEKALNSHDTCLVIIGPGDVGPWHHQEMQMALSRLAMDRQYRVIPVLLPKAKRGKRGAVDFLTNLNCVDFPNSIEDPLGFDKLVRGIRRTSMRRAGVVNKTACPYLGLRTFDIKDAPYFYGREALTDWLVSDVRRLIASNQEPRFLAIVGASGSGKSSVARAGLLYELQQGAIEGSKEWLRIIIDHPGADPITELATRGCKTLGLPTDDPNRLDEVFIKPVRDDSDKRNLLHSQANIALTQQNKQQLLIFIDQFEEIFTACEDNVKRERFIDLLLHAAGVNGGKVLVVITIRMDFLPKCVDYPKLAAVLSGGGTELVGAMSDTELETAIADPAGLAGVSLTSSLIKTLVHAVRTQPGSLPLLEHVLAELWKIKEGSNISDDDYIHKIGGIDGALERRAEQLLSDYRGGQQRREILALLTRLVHVSDSSDTDTRARYAVTEAEYKLLKPFVEAHLLITSTDGQNGDNGKRIIEVAHEALIRHWPTLQEALKDKREVLIWQQTIRSQFQTWQRLKEAGAAIEFQEKQLLQGLHLEDGTKWLKDCPDALSPNERAFIKQSQKFEDTREIRDWRKKVRAKYLAWKACIKDNATFAELDQCHLQSDALEDGQKWLEKQLSDLIDDEVKFIEQSLKFAELRDWRKQIQPLYSQWLEFTESSNTEQRAKLLLKGDLLEQGLIWLNKHQIDSEGKEGKYIQQSHTQRNKNQIKRRRKIRAGISLPIFLITASLVYVGLLSLDIFSWRLASRAISIRLLDDNDAKAALHIPSMKEIPPGHFSMGSSKADIDDGRANKDEDPQHPVSFEKPFYIGVYEVKVSEYKVFLDDIATHGYTCERWTKAEAPLFKYIEPGDEQPAIFVSWHNASCYARWLSFLTGKNYHLPSEAEWEYAARAETTSEYYWDGQGEAKDFAWYADNYEGKTHPVGKRNPNAFGLYDMSGNVWEWVQDCWHDNYNKAPRDGSSWQEQNNGDCNSRVLRGGFWSFRQDSLRSANRSWSNPDDRSHVVGFRLAQD